jgi:hypothetical protein
MDNSRFGFIPSGSNNNLPFEAHLEKLQEPARSLMNDLRDFTKSLGPGVIEEVRPHRVVYAKTLTFRTFLDVEPAADHLVVETRSSRQEPPVRSVVRTQQDADRVKEMIARAFEKIR